MAVNLVKGQKIDLTKKGDKLDRIHVGLGWDPVSSGKTGGFFKKLLSSAPEIDCDASVIMLNEKGVMQSNKDLIYFGNLQSGCKSVKHTGDNLTGDGDGDDEVIFVSLKSIPAHIHKLVFVVNIYDCARRNQHFGMIQNAFIRIVDQTTKKELIRYQLSDDYANQTSLIVGEIYRRDNEWKFSATGVGTTDTGIKTIINRYK
ncbi:TerD family protein [Marinilabiliaceae bacterium JC017]|nr:TerD family protein [Marinilabiliaceae bacterium JC017]